MRTGKYTEQQLLKYESVDLTENGEMRAMLDRDEFNFSINLQFGDVPIHMVRETLTRITIEQKQRLLQPSTDHVQRLHLGGRLYSLLL
jgi:anaerobic magnesium-protoporphyrin IX monomethyl ester cyclase